MYEKFTRIEGLTMSKRDFTQIFERIAQAHNTTVENVKREIEAASRDGFYHHDPKGKEQLVIIPRKKK